MFTILLDIWHHICGLKPAFISKTPHFNFITVHYFWIMGLAIFGSICLYPRGGGLAYIDALFLSSGAATQSGLNTVNINDINTWQQVALHCIAMCGNPITINTFVVFLRLYWFEKRFQHIAMEAKKNRRSTSKSFSKSKTAERDIGREERGVQGRDIVVMHESARGMKNEGAEPEDLERYLKEAVNQEERPRSSNESGEGSGQSSDSADERKESAAQQHQTQIRFADQVKRSDNLSDQPLQVPAQRKTEEHIAFLERQRNPDDDTVLRIPGPRDADAGVDPQTVDQSESTQQISRRRSTFDSSRESDDQGHFSPLNGDDTATNEPRRRNITITEPTRRETPKEHIEEDAIAAKHVFGALRFRKPRILHGEKLHNDADTPHPSRSRRSSTFQSFRQALSQDKDGGIPYLSWEPTVGRNSAFVDLTESQREELGGIEYRSLKSLALILTLYFWGFWLFGVVCLLPWILNSQTYGSIVEQDGQGRVWWGIFTANSAFTDLGYTLTPDSMISFNTAVWPLLLMSFLIIIGNTGFPIMLRIIIWVTSLYVPKNSGIFEELKFLLDHPRRCFTLLFPSKATWWLFWILVILNGLDLIFFIVLDLGNTIVTQLPVNIRVLDGWFQAVSTRTAGFGVVNLANLHPAIQVSYLLMMYISVLPIAISVRRTNVYEEKSLGIYGSAAEENEDEGEPSYVGAHLRRQLSFDLWYIFLGFFIIAIAEGDRIQSGDPNFTMFDILFEIVSAYGTVGLSLGYPTTDASFSSQFGIISKLVIISMQIRGRHRGLPYELDRAILLPSEHLQEKENADQNNIRRRSSAGTFGGNTGVSSRAQKQRTRARSRSSQRPGHNFLSTLLHPGPTIPNSHRDGLRDGEVFSRTSSRGRDVSPKSNGVSLEGSNGDEHGEAKKVEGRRSFYQEGVNPPPEEYGRRSTEADATTDAI